MGDSEKQFLELFLLTRSLPEDHHSRVILAQLSIPEFR